ncbi:MAG: ABC transporter permease [Clostridia bacterium]|nr:ABC transporter permease [Clostridia bacterium]
MKLALQKAFELMGSNDPLLTNIVNTTLRMAFTSSAIALLLGVLIGLLVASHEFYGKKVIVIIMRTLMGLPPVFVGILLYLLFSGTGPFGSLKLIYSVDLMVIAQVVLITPIVAGMTETSMTPIVNKMRPTMKGLKLNGFKQFGLMVNEGKYQLISVYLFAFARAISEVGAVQIVGGNILYKTRVMTTAIALNYNTGEFELAMALGIILLFIALATNMVAAILQFGLWKKK